MCRTGDGFHPGLFIPEKYDLVVNDTFELFWNGIMLCKDYTRYYISAVSNIKGHSFRNKFEVSPTAAGTYPLEITISDDAGKIIDSKTVQLVVKQVLTTSPQILNMVIALEPYKSGRLQWLN